MQKTSFHSKSRLVRISDPHCRGEISKLRLVLAMLPSWVLATLPSVSDVELNYYQKLRMIATPQKHVRKCVLNYPGCVVGLQGSVRARLFGQDNGS